MTKKQRGGQPDNKNAFKHGFYSKHFVAAEKRALAKITPSDLEPEIDLLRVSIERFLQVYTASLGELDYEQSLAALRAITIAAGRIANLERIQAYVRPRAEEAQELMEKIEKMGSDLPAEEDVSTDSTYQSVMPQ